MRQLIYDGGRIAAAVNAAQRSETAFADDYRRELQIVAYNVAQAYYAYLGAQRTTQVDLEIVRQDVVQEDLVRAQVRAGTEARAQIATAQLPTAQARLAVVRAQGAELAAEAAFANAMGLDANVRVQPVDDAPVFTKSEVSTVPIPTYDEAVRRALALRPDYDPSLQIVQQDQYSLKSAKLGLVSDAGRRARRRAIIRATRTAALSATRRASVFRSRSRSTIKASPPPTSRARAPT